MATIVDPNFSDASSPTRIAGSSARCGMETLRIRLQAADLRWRIAEPRLPSGLQGSRGRDLEPDPIECGEALVTGVRFRIGRRSRQGLWPVGFEPWCRMPRGAPGGNSGQVGQRRLTLDGCAG